MELAKNMFGVRTDGYSGKADAGKMKLLQIPYISRTDPPALVRAVRGSSVPSFTKKTRNTGKTPKYRKDQ